VNRGCYEAFAAIYDCEVPVISAIHGFCLGGGIGIAGASDIVLASDDATVGSVAHMGRLATALERSLRFETTGHVNGYDVQRAHLALRGDSGSLYALRDAAGIFRLAMYAPGGALHYRRKDVAHPWQENVSWDVGALVALLRRNNFLPSWIDAAPGDEAPEARQVRALFDRPNPRGRVRLLPGERAVSCLKASPGRAVGLARLGTRAAIPTWGGVLSLDNVPGGPALPVARRHRRTEAHPRCRLMACNGRPR
jgi:hypothetical protein